MDQKITFRAVIEVLGKPKEHVETSLQGYVEKLRKDSNYQIIKEDYAESKKQEEQELWTTFAEVEVKTSKADFLVDFCFEYMPSMIEVIEPSEIKFPELEFSQFLNNLQARLHQVDMVAKQMKMENMNLKKNTAGLLRNYLYVLLANKGMTSAQLSKFTGVAEDKLEDYLDQLIDEGKVDLKDGLYIRKVN